MRVDHPQKIRLKDIPTRAPKDTDRKDTEQETEQLGGRMEELFDLLTYAGRHSLLIVLQGMDAAGKDGSIRHLLKNTHAQSVDVASFKVPTPEELGHDFLWRCHKKTPAHGEIVLFNRSHYEDVLVVRVHDLVPKGVWSQRYDHINAWESLLAGSRTIVMKVFLHITREEQEERLRDREKEVEKAWKLSVGDWKEREFWDDYQAAYEDAIGRCAASHAAWHVIPADQKWYRNYELTKAVVETLEPYAEGWLAHLAQVGEEAKAELEEFRVSP